MKNNFTFKRLIVGLLAFAVGLMTLLCLAIPLIRMPPEYSEGLASSLTCETGFSLMDFNLNRLFASVAAEEYLDDGGIVAAGGALSIIQLLLSIATMIIACLTVFFTKNKVRRGLNIGLTVGCLIFNLVYMIIGIVAVKMFEFYYPLETLAYLGFIFTALLFIAFIVCEAVLKEHAISVQNKVLAPVAATAVHTENLSAKEAAEALKQYKELLDDGIITQQEFDKKKAEILNMQA